MICSNCRAQYEGTMCAGCQRTLPPGARGPIDPVTGMMLAGFGRRVGQMFADQLILVIPVEVFVAVFDQIGGDFLGGLAGFIVTALYLFKCFTTKGGQSIGNRVAATRVRDADTGAMLAPQQALIRTSMVMFYFVGAYALHATPFFVVVVVVGIVDNFYPLIDKRNQTLHDKIAKTIVVVA
jgi:uncharacterized RDD family membrane protein YckC